MPQVTPLMENLLGDRLIGMMGMYRPRQSGLWLGLVGLLGRKAWVIPSGHGPGRVDGDGHREDVRPVGARLDTL